MTFAVRLLGPLTIEVDGRAVDLGGLQQRASIAVLVLNRNRPVGLERLVDRMWPDDPPPTAAKTIQVYLSRLRRGLGDESGRLTLRGSGYTLRIGDDEIDAAPFEQLVASASAAARRAEDRTVIDQLTSALELWRGDALADLVTTNVGRREAARLDELRVQAMQDLLGARFRTDGGHAVVADLRALLAQHPAREDLWRQLMQVLYADGRQGDALEAYQEARRYLADELGLEPSDQLRELETQILTQDSRLRLDVAHDRPTDPWAAGWTRQGASDESADLDQPRLVGRDAELETVDAVIARAATGSPQVLLLEGEAGVGKTRFVAELTARAGASGAWAVTGTCLQLGGDRLPYLPILEAMRALADRVPQDRLRALLGPAAIELGGFIPGFAAATDGATEFDPTSDYAQARMFELLLAFLERCSAERPLVLVFDDVHWADHSTIELLGFIAASARRARLLLVLAFRPIDADDAGRIALLANDLERRGRASRLQIGPLQRNAVTAQLEGLLGAPPKAALVDAIYERSRGNPLFTRELAIAVREGDGDRLPRTLREMLLQRLAGLDSASRELVEAASVAGPRTSERVIGRICNLADEQVAGGLAAVVERGVLDAEGDWRGTAYAFSHPLLHQAVYESIAVNQRRRLHARVALLIEEGLTGAGPDATDAALLARHWILAEDRERALGASRTAARAATDSLAHEEAYRHYVTAIDLLDRDGAVQAPSKREDLLDEAAAAAVRSGRYEEAVELTRRALAETPGDGGTRRVALTTALATDLARQGRLNLATDAIRAAMAIRPSGVAPATRAAAMAEFGRILMVGGHLDEAKTACERALTLARRIGLRAVESHVLTSLGTAMGELGDVAGGQAAIEQGLAIARELDSAGDMMRAFNNLSVVLEEAGRYEQSLEALLRAFDVVAERGLARTEGVLLLTNAAWQLFRLGRWDEADRFLDEALEGTPQAVAIQVPTIKGWIQVRRGDVARAGVILDNAMAEQREWGPIAATDLVLARAEVAVAEDRFGDALAALDAAAERTGEWYKLVIELAAAACRHLATGVARGRIDPASREVNPAMDGETWVQRARDAMARIVGRGHPLTSFTAATMLVVEAEFARCQGRLDPDAWAGVAEAWIEVGIPYNVAFARIREGEAARRAGDEDRAAVADGEAREIAERIGAGSLVAQIDSTSLAVPLKRRRRQRVPVTP